MKHSATIILTTIAVLSIDMACGYPEYRSGRTENEKYGHRFRRRLRYRRQQPPPDLRPELRHSWPDPVTFNGMRNEVIDKVLDNVSSEFETVLPQLADNFVRERTGKAPTSEQQVPTHEVHEGPVEAEEPTMSGGGAEYVQPDAGVQQPQALRGDAESEVDYGQVENRPAGSGSAANYEYDGGSHGYPNNGPKTDQFGFQVATQEEGTPSCAAILTNSVAILVVPLLSTAHALQI